jgi:ribonuclease HI
VFTAILQLLWKDARSKYPITLRWIPTHKGIRGNHIIDKEAKKMTTLGRTPTRRLITKRKSLLKGLEEVAITTF